LPAAHRALSDRAHPAHPAHPDGQARLASSHLAGGTIDAFSESQEFIVQNQNNRPVVSGGQKSAETITETIEAAASPWHSQVGQLLTDAAALCVEHGVDLDAFMKGAWSAYVESRPGMRDYLEEMQLRDQLDEIRKNGQMAQA
jgi:hypothetical protein